MDGASYSLMVYIIMSIIILPSNPSFSCCNSTIRFIIVMLPYVLHSYVRFFSLTYFHHPSNMHAMVAFDHPHIVKNTLSLANCQDSPALSLALKLKHVG